MLGAAVALARSVLVMTLLAFRRQVAPAEEDQRSGVVGAGLDLPDPPDDDLVVAAFELVLDRALEGGDHPVEARAAGTAAAVPDSLPGGGEAAAGEVGRQVLLAGAEHVDRERAVGPDRLQGLARPVEADQDQRRVER